MKRSLSVPLVFGFLSAANWQVLAREHPSQSIPGPHLSIHLHNLADVSSRILDHATQDAAGILATAGVNTIWQQVRRTAPQFARWLCLGRTGW
jgi:hypothetical protein